MALFLDRVLTAPLVDRPHGLAVEGARAAESVLPCAIVMLSVLLVVLSVGRRHLERAVEKQAEPSKRQHVRAARSPSAFRMLCQELDTRVKTQPTEKSVPSSRSVRQRSTRLRERLRRGSIDCCMSQPQIVPACEVALQGSPSQAEEVRQASEAASILPGCEVTLQNDEVVQVGARASETADSSAQEVVRLSEAVENVERVSESAMPVRRSSEEPRTAADASLVSNGSDLDTPVATVGSAVTDTAAVGSVATDTVEASIEAPPGLGRCCEINSSFGDVVEGTSAAKDKGATVGGWPQTLGALRSALDGSDHSTSGPDAASPSVWGCYVQQVYSNSLLLAHRSMHLKISKGAPGLHRMQDSSPASVRGTPQSEMLKSVPAQDVGSLRERAAVQRLLSQTPPLFHVAPNGTPCTKLKAGFKRTPLQQWFALQRRDVKPRSASAGPATRLLANGRVALDVLGPPPAGSR